jgi:hypothetical protein
MARKHIASVSEAPILLIFPRWGVFQTDSGGAKGESLAPGNQIALGRWSSAIHLGDGKL